MTHPAKPYDARAVANLLLDRAAERNLRVSNLALQKLLFFLHGLYLVRSGRPLVDGYFEAWRHGPVHPAVYQAFKDAGAEPIEHRAVGRDIRAGTPVVLSTPADEDLESILDHVLATLGRLPPGRLIDISHAPNGPWHFVVNERGTESGLGLRIPDTILKE